MKDIKPINILRELEHDGIHFVSLHVQDMLQPPCGTTRRQMRHDVRIWCQSTWRQMEHELRIRRQCQSKWRQHILVCHLTSVWALRPQVSTCCIHRVQMWREWATIPLFGRHQVLQYIRLLFVPTNLAGKRLSVGHVSKHFFFALKEKKIFPMCKRLVLIVEILVRNKSIPIS